MLCRPRSNQTPRTAALFWAVMAAGCATVVADHASAQTPDLRDDERVVLMELYTSQGCAACPPADQMMLDLAARDDVIALALHVDYWDYIGWVDSFAQPQFGDRQKDYARRHGHSTIYTPQVILNGTEILEGFRVMSVMDALDRHGDAAPEVMLSLSRDAATGMLSIHAETMDAVAPQIAMTSRRIGVPMAQSNAVVGSLSMSGSADTNTEASADQPQDETTASVSASRPAPFVVDLVRYLPLAQVDIMAGENAGLLADYANIVTEWSTVGQWDMAAPLSLQVPVDGDGPLVVVIQERGLGEVIAAARLR